MHMFPGGFKGTEKPHPECEHHHPMVEGVWNVCVKRRKRMEDLCSSLCSLLLILNAQLSLAPSMTSPPCDAPYSQISSQTQLLLSCFVVATRKATNAHMSVCLASPTHSENMLFSLLFLMPIVLVFYLEEINDCIGSQQLKFNIM